MRVVATRVLQVCGSKSGSFSGLALEPPVLLAVRDALALSITTTGLHIRVE